MLDILNQGLSIVLSQIFSRLFFAIIGGLLLAFSLAGYGLGFLAWFALIPLFLLIKSSNTLKGSLFDSFIFLTVYNLATFIWLLALHPLTWQGLTTQESILVSLLAWFTPSITHTLILLPFSIALKLLLMFRADNRSFELKILDIMFLAFIWIVIEYKIMLGLGDNLRSFFVPINFIAYSQYQNLYLIQIANAIGSIGIEFFIVFVNLLLSNLFNVHKVFDQSKIYTSSLNIKKQFFGIERTSDYIKIGAIMLVFIIGIYYYGYQNIHEYEDKRLSSPLKSVAILQADFSAKFTRSTEGFEKLILLQKNLSQTIQKKVDFLFWAEGAIPQINYSGLNLARELEATTNNFAFGTFISENGKTFNGLDNYSFEEEFSKKPVLKDLSEINTKTVQELSVELKKEENAPLVQTETVEAEEDTPSEENETVEDKSSDENETVETKEETLSEFSQSELVIKPEISVQQVYNIHAKILNDKYRKNLLVPYGEYTPFYQQLPEKLKLLANHSIGSGFDASNEIKNIQTPYGNYAPNICFEILFPEHIRKFIKDDTGFIVNINDLSWFKNPIKIFGIELSFMRGFVHRMMLSAATFRAIENNRDLVLASNSGISTIIQATGARNKESKINSIELIEDKLLLQRDLSIYTKYGF
jgi:apolipoprotein N-acyltransferase